MTKKEVLETFKNRLEPSLLEAHNEGILYQAWQDFVQDLYSKKLLSKRALSWKNPYGKN